MESEVEDEKKILQDIYGLRLEGREKYLKMMGINIEQLREVEKELDSKYSELAIKLQEIKRERVNERAKIQKRDLENSKLLLRQAAKKANSADLSSQTAVIEHLYPEYHGEPVSHQIGTPHIVMVHCHNTTELRNQEDHGYSVFLNPPVGNGCNGSVEFKESSGKGFTGKEPAGTAQPFANVQGMGTGTINAVTVNTWFKFTFTPITEGPYCIRPMVLINGWWLLWTWGSCNGTPEDVGIGNMHVKIKVRVDQLSAKIKEREHIVQKENTNSGSSKEGALYYYSETDPGTSMNVYLKKDHEAIIFVECEVFAEVKNYGRAIIDMQSGEGFYFTVDSVFIDKLHIHFLP